MLEMMEVIGVSPAGFTEAVKSGVDALTAAGKKVHFFQVVEHRGSVRQGVIAEYQAVIKAAVER